MEHDDLDLVALFDSIDCENSGEGVGDSLSLDPDEIEFLSEEPEVRVQGVSDETHQVDEDFAFAYAELAATSEFVPQKQPSSKETRGRKRGSVSLRKAMDEVDVDMDELDRPPALPELTSIEFARQCKAEKSRKLLKEQQSQEALVMVGDVETLDSIAKVLDGLRSNASHLQCCLLNASAYSFTFQEQSIRQQSLCHKLLGTPVLSNRGLSMLTNTSEARFGEKSAAVACSIHEMGSFLWGGMLLAIQQGIESGRFKPLQIVRRFRYDETPLKSRVKLIDKSTAEFQQDSASHSKLMQSEFYLQLLIQDTARDQLFLLCGRLPTVLQAIERTTARCTKRCLVNIMCKIPLLDSVADLFPHKVHMSCTDRYAANILAEKSMKIDSPAWTRSQFFCDAHRIHQIQSSNLSLVPQDASGLLATALAQRDLGALATLRSLLRQILEERLEVCYDHPPQGRAQEFRDQVFDRFLPLPTDLSKRRKDCKTWLRLRQRFVLGSLLNGDLESECVVHYCTYGCCDGYPDTLHKVQKWLVNAFLPHKCPKYCASRWTGQEAAITWCALLQAHHHLFEDLMVRFAGGLPQSQAVPVAAPVGDMDDNAFMNNLLEDHCQTVQEQGPKDRVAGEYDWGGIADTQASSACILASCRYVTVNSPLIINHYSLVIISHDGKLKPLSFQYYTTTCCLGRMLVLWGTFT